MSNENQHNDFVNFRKYYTGNMSAKEKTAFEENLESDPFAKDAYEGFLFYEKDFDKISAIEKTNMAFKDKIGIETDSTISLKPILAIAASVIVLFSAFFVIQNSFFDGSNSNTVAKNDIETPVIEEQKELQEEEMFVLDSISDSEAFEIDQDIIIEEEVTERQIEKDNTKTLKEQSKTSSEPKTEASKANKKQITAEDFYNGNIQQESLSDKNKSTNKDKITDIKGNETAQYNSLYYNDAATINETNSETESSLSNFKSGIVAYNLGSYNKAIEEFEASLKKNQSINSSNFYIGMSYFNTNKQNKAINAFDKVIDSSSSFADDAMWYKALSLINKGQDSRAKPILQTLIDNNSSFKTAAQNKLNKL